MSDLPSGRSNPTVHSSARADFDRALFKSFWREVRSFLTQADNSLLPYDEFQKMLPLKGSHYMGHKEVPIQQIVGSVSRYLDFDGAFLPRQSRTRERWISIDRAHLEDVPLPPIELYKIGEAYFVKDGNHRVSVAREKGQVFIDAVVIDVQVGVPVSADTNLADLILKREQADFLEYTQLDEIRPGSDLALTLPGQYDKLLEHISVHRYFLGQQQNHDIPYTEAVASWFDQVYMPLVTIIRQRGMLAEFPHRTETDLYLWIIEHRWYLRETFEDEISLEEAADGFSRDYPQRPWKKLLKLLRQLLEKMRAR